MWAQTHTCRHMYAQTNVQTRGHVFACMHTLVLQQPEEEGLLAALLRAAHAPSPGQARVQARLNASPYGHAQALAQQQQQQQQQQQGLLLVGPNPSDPAKQPCAPSARGHAVVAAAGDGDELELEEEEEGQHQGPQHASPPLLLNQWQYKHEVRAGLCNMRWGLAHVWILSLRWLWMHMRDAHVRCTCEMHGSCVSRTRGQGKGSRWCLRKKEGQ